MSDVLTPAPGGATQPACPGCGAPAVSGAAFCHKCGNPLGAAAPFEPPAPPPVFGQPGDAGPGPGTTLPGWGEPAQPQGAPAGQPPPLGAPPAAGQPWGQRPAGGQAHGWGQPGGSQRPPAPSTSPYSPPYAQAGGGRSRIVAALLAFFLGGLGAHKFYLGRPLLGVLYLLFGWTLIPSLVAFVEFILLLVMSDEKFKARYGHLQGSGAVVVLVVLGAGFAGIAVIGILAAIAIPNFVKYQLRAKAAEVPALLVALDRAEVARREAGDDYVVFPDGLPADQAAGAAKLAWAPEDLEVAAGLGWSPGAATYGRYAVEGQQDEEGNQAIALCGETDLDGDGARGAWAIFRPALAEDGSMVVPPPAAPCSEAVVLREGVTLEFDPVTPPGAVVRLSPDDVY